MDLVPPDWLPRARIPAVCVNITSKYILLQALQTLKITGCETTTHDFLSDEIIAAVSFEIPPHGDYFFAKKEKFYGEPCKTREEAIESAHQAALRYLQKEAVVFIDVANLNELAECKRSLLRAMSWADGFEMKCASQKTELAAMAEHIRMMSSETILSSAAESDMDQEILPRYAAPSLYGKGIVEEHIIPGMLSSPAKKLGFSTAIPLEEVTPLRAAAISKESATITPKDLGAAVLDDAADSDKDRLPRASTRRALFLDH